MMCNVNVNSSEISTGKSALQIDRRRTGVELVRDALRAAILRGEFGKDGRLTFTEIAAKVGTSVTPVREAVRDLVGEGLVSMDLYKGARVHTPTLGELREVYALRMMLEARAMAEMASLPTATRLETCIGAEALCQEMSTAIDVATWTALNRDFHAMLVRPLVETWPRLCTTIEGLRNVSLLPVAEALRADEELVHRADCDHLALIEAIREGRPKQAAKIIEKHLEQTFAALAG